MTEEEAKKLVQEIQGKHYICGFCGEKVPGLIYIGPGKEKAVCEQCYNLDLERAAVERPYSKMAKRVGLFLFGFDYYRKLARSRFEFSLHRR